MRRHIRLTGRKQLARSSVEVKLFDTDKGKRVSLTITKPQAFKTLSPSARVKLRLFENHFSETLVFGTLGEVAKGAKAVALQNRAAFSAPSAQLRVVAASGERPGLVLGSTRRWTLHMEGEDNGENTSEGILRLQAKNISPRTWKLDTREDEHPIVYIDSKIPNPYAWVQSDPMFATCVLPAIIRELFDDIFRVYDDPELEWVEDWINWARTLLRNKDIPWGEYEDQKKWINELLDEFCRQHDMLNKLVSGLRQDESA